MRPVERRIEDHQIANQSYLDESAQLPELAARAHELFRKQEPREQRRLLDFVLSNGTWKDNELTPTFRKPFDLIAVAAESARAKTTASADTGNRRLVMGG